MGGAGSSQCLAGEVTTGTPEKRSRALAPARHETSVSISPNAMSVRPAPDHGFRVPRAWAIREPRLAFLKAPPRSILGATASYLRGGAGRGGRLGAARLDDEGGAAGRLGGGDSLGDLDTSEGGGGGNHGCWCVRECPSASSPQPFYLCQNDFERSDWTDHGKKIKLSARIRAAHLITAVFFLFCAGFLPALFSRHLSYPAPQSYDGGGRAHHARARGPG